MKLNFPKNMTTSRMLSVLFCSVLFCSMITITSCNKETLQTPTEQLQTVAGYRLNVDPLELIGKNEADLEDEAINHNLLILSSSINEITKTGQFTSEINELVKKSHYITINDLRTALPEFNSLLQSHINISRFNQYYRTESTLDDYTGDFEHLDELYDAILYVYNYNDADLTETPIVSSGIEVEDNDELGIDDCIFSYYTDDAGVTYDIILSEEEAKTAVNPVYIITIENFEEDGGKLSSPQIKTTVLSQNLTNFKVGNSNIPYKLQATEVMINYAYETSGKSEYYVTASYIRADDGTPNAFFIEEENHPVDFLGAPSPVETSKRFKKIDPSNLGNPLAIDVNFYYQLPLPGDVYQPQYTGTTIFFNSYEYDWYILDLYLKDLGTGYLGAYNINLVARMKYDNEWYLIAPASYPIGLNNYTIPAYTESVEYSNEKGSFTLETQDF